MLDKVVFVFALILSSLVSFGCDAKLSAKQEAKFYVRAEYTVTKLLNARDKPIEKMIEYVLRIKKDRDKTFKGDLVMSSFLNYAFDKIKESGFELSYEQKRFFRSEFKAKFSPLTPEQIAAIEETIANEISIIKKGSISSESQLVYGVSLIICGVILQNTNVQSCVLRGRDLEQIGLAECLEFFTVNNKS